jgi:hypothetical protein
MPRVRRATRHFLWHTVKDEPSRVDCALLVHLQEEQKKLKEAAAKLKAGKKH